MMRCLTGAVLVVMLLMRTFNLPAVVAAEANDHNENHVQQQQQQQKEAALRLIRLSLTAPHADPVAILHDANALFPGVFEKDELLQLVMDESKAPSTAASKSIHDVTTDTPDTPDTDAVSTSPPSEEYELSQYADRHVRRINEARHDYDCMEREFDLSDPKFKASDAAKVFHKCRLVVLRNVWPQDVILDYKIKLSNYISNLHEGNIDAHRGKTTTGDNEALYVRRNKKRFDILIPVYLRVKEIIANSIVRRILKHSQVLGSDFIVNTVGCVIAESGAPEGSYHYDDEYILGTNAFEKYKLAGTDLPPVALSMFIPMLNATLQHGPTEFCMGTQHFKGLSIDSPVLNTSLIADGTDYYNIAAFEEDKEIEGGCPLAHRRTPTANLGDAILFDYTITHRGGPNTSPDLRAMQYVMYSRDWFRDGNFDAADYNYDNEEEHELSLEEEMTRLTRFALVEELHDCPTPPCPERIPLESIRNFLKPFKNKNNNNNNNNKKKKEKLLDNNTAMTTKFQITNHDLAHGAFLWVGNTQHIADLALGESITLTLPIGTTLRLWDLDDVLIETWKITPDQMPLILKHDELYDDDDTNKNHDHDELSVPAPAQVRTIITTPTNNNMEEEDDEEEDEDDDDDTLESNNETAEEL